MKITKHGTVTFQDRKIVSIEGFVVDGNADELKEYVISHYVYSEGRGDGKG